MWTFLRKYVKWQKSSLTASHFPCVHMRWRAPDQNVPGDRCGFPWSDDTRFPMWWWRAFHLSMTSSWTHCQAVLFRVCKTFRLEATHANMQAQGALSRCPWTNKWSDLSRVPTHFPTVIWWRAHGLMTSRTVIMIMGTWWWPRVHSHGFFFYILIMSVWSDHSFIMMRVLSHVNTRMVCCVWIIETSFIVRINMYVSGGSRQTQTHVCLQSCFRYNYITMFFCC